MKWATLIVKDAAKFYGFQSTLPMKGATSIHWELIRQRSEHRKLAVSKQVARSAWQPEPDTKKTRRRHLGSPFRVDGTFIGIRRSLLLSSVLPSTRWKILRFAQGKPCKRFRIQDSRSLACDCPTRTGGANGSALGSKPRGCRFDSCPARLRRRANDDTFFSLHITLLDALHETFHAGQGWNYQRTIRGHHGRKLSN